MDEYKEGRKCLDEHDIAAARRYFQAGTDKKDPRCIYGLFAVSSIVNIDVANHLEKLKAAFPLLVALAKGGNSDACFIVARCYETGSAVCLNLHLAMEYYTRAANLGNPDAMYNLGCIYMNFGKNEDKALSCFRQAAENGCEDAKKAIERLEKE